MSVPPAPAEVAVLGMACRVPGADSVTALWQLVSRAGCALGPVPTDRPTLADLDGSRGAGWGGFLPDVHCFDAQHFGISPAEAPHVDVQQRLVLETAWHALEDAGIPVTSLAGSRTGVFVGQASHDHAMLYERGGVAPSPFVNTGMSHALAANRLSYHWDLRGPSMAVDTACSSSLTAVHLAVRSLRSGDCDLAIVAGVSALLSPWPQQGAAALTALSPTGRCRPFDAEADGYVRAEGVGVVVLRRVADLRGEPVRAVVRGSAVNQDGRTNGLTAPSGRAQTEVLRSALADARTEPAELAYVEAHGTGTPLGDPIEARALAEAMTGRTFPLPVGSAKGNVGHTEAAAGIVGLIRAICVLRRREVPPQAGHARPNPRVDLLRLGLTVPTAPVELRGDDLVAGVSSFGFGGTNAHVVLAASPRQPTPRRPRQHREPSRRRTAEPAPQASCEPVQPLLLVSGSGPAAVRDLLVRYADLLDDAVADGGTQAAASVVAAARAQRSHLTYRVAVPAGSLEELAANARAAAAEREPRRIPLGRPRVGFVYSGHGSQWIGMGRRMLAEDQVFAAAVAECDTAFSALLGRSITELLLHHGAADLDDVTVVQPLLFTLQVALTRSLSAYGVVPHAVVGHSVGEVAAAVAAGTLSVADACAVVHARNRAVAGVRGAGGMAVVELPAGEMTAMIADLGTEVDIAAVNGPRSCVVSGRDDQLTRLLASAEASGVDCRRVRVDYPSHSRLMGPAAEALSRALGGLGGAEPEVTVYSTVFGGRLEGRHDAGYWGRNLRDRVRFAEAVEAMRRDGVTHLVEIAPHPVLTPAIRDCVDADAVVLSALTKAPGGDVLTSLLGSLYEAGLDVAAPGDAAGFGAAGVRLPLYPFDHTRSYELPFARSATGADTRVVPTELLTGHVVAGTQLLPAVSLALFGLALSSGSDPEDAVGGVSGVELLAPVAADEEVRHRPGARCVTDGAGRELVRWAEAGPRVLGAQGVAEDGHPVDPGAEPADAVPVDVLGHAERASATGLDVSESTALISGLRRSGTDAWAEVEHRPGTPGAGARTLDAALLAAILTRLDAMATEPRDSGADARIPVTSLDGLVMTRPVRALPAGRLRVTVHGATASGVAEVTVRDRAGATVARLTGVTFGHPHEDTGTAPRVLSGVPEPSRRTADEVRGVVREALATVVPGADASPGADRIPFAELGLDSLLAAELRDRIERRLSIRVSMSAFWRHPTVEQLAAALAEDSDTTADPLSELMAALDPGEQRESA